MAIAKTSLKAQAKEYLLTYIQEKKLNPGDRLATQRELAETLQISQKVAQLALNDLEEEGIIVRRLGSGTFLARRHDLTPRTPTSGRNIFVLIPNLKNPQFSEFAAEAEAALQKHKKQMRLMTTHTSLSFREIISIMVEEGCGGIITAELPPVLKNFIKQYHIPAALIRVMAPPRQMLRTTHEIILDVKEQAILLAEHLLSRGYRNFYLAGGIAGPQNCRFHVMRKLLEKAGAEIQQIPEEDENSKELDYENIGQELANKILRCYQPSSVAVFYNTARAMGAMKVFQHLGKKIPQDIAIAGFDNIFPARLVEPELTVTDARYTECAQQAVSLVLSRDREPTTLTIDPVLCYGRSVGNLTEK